jgi:hypothetical protein
MNVKIIIMMLSSVMIDLLFESAFYLFADRLDFKVTLFVSLGPSPNERESLEHRHPERCHLQVHHRIASLLQPPTSHIPTRQSANMAEGMFYNVTAGYIEGIVRGYRNTLLTGQNYGNLTQCETIDGMAIPQQAKKAYLGTC